jgi:FixJ family two-component response regulator
VKHFIAKPFSADALLKLVRMILDASDSSKRAEEDQPSRCEPAG